MKFNKLFYLMSAGLMMTGLASCSQDEPNAAVDSNGNLLVKAPKVLAYSGNTILTPGGVMSRAANVDGNLWYQSWDTPENVYPELTAEDLAIIKEMLSPGHQVQNEIILPWENYWVQQVYKGQAPDEQYYTHDRCNDSSCDHVNSDRVVGSDKMEHLKAYNSDVTNTNYGGYWDAELNQWVQVITEDHYEHINNFNNGNNLSEYTEDGNSLVNPNGKYYGTTLMTGMATEGLTPDNQFGFDETWGTDPKFYNNYYIIEYKGYYYVGFDYEAHKNDQTTHNHGEGMDIERDWCFTDWIVRISPAYPAGTNSDNPGGVTPEPGTPDINIPENPDPNFPVTPDQPGVNGDNHRNEVEVNLHAVNKGEDRENPDYLESHLSIHVRHATDVEIFIPIPKNAYLDADDMAIVMKHEENHMGHGGPLSYTYTLKDSDLQVTLNIEYQDNGIRIWTEGVNQDVIDWCAEKCHGDGITFELWNYFDPKEIDLNTLKSYLNQATVKFLDSTPDYYINAFMDKEDGAIQENDCTVSIVEEQANEYGEGKTGGHLNGSPYNEIYTKNGVSEGGTE